MNCSYVSIRARHCWRANRAMLLGSGHRRCSFNPRPPLLAGESDRRATTQELCAVSIRARHCWRANRPLAWRLRLRPGSFNPRPPLLAGESVLAHA